MHEAERRHIDDRVQRAAMLIRRINGSLNRRQSAELNSLHAHPSHEAAGIDHQAAAGSGSAGGCKRGREVLRGSLEFRVKCPAYGIVREFTARPSTEY